MRYIYNDEDNVSMNDDAFDGIHNPTVYGSRAEMKHWEEPLPFTDPPLPEKGCWNCLEYDGDRCMKNWNNMDESYYNPDTDDRDPSDHCELWERDENAVWEDFFGED